MIPVAMVTERIRTGEDATPLPKVAKEGIERNEPTKTFISNQL